MAGCCFPLGSIHTDQKRQRNYSLMCVIFLPPATKLRQGNVFTPDCHSVDRGEWQTPLGRHPPWSRPPLGADTPLEQTPPPLGADPPGADTPQEQTPPRSRHPPLHSACWEIRATSGWYAFYWNAYLSLIFFAFASAFARCECTIPIHTVQS